jgi:hypothetical protein
LSILRSGAGTGLFVLTEKKSILKQEAVASPIGWFEDFDLWQRTAFLDDLTQVAKILSLDSDSGLKELAQASLEHLRGIAATNVEDLVALLATQSKDYQARIEALKQVSDRIAREALNAQVNKDRNFISAFAKFLASIRDLQEPWEEDDADDPDGEEEEDAPDGAAAQAAAVREYLRNVRAQARAKVRGRKLGTQSNVARVAEWIGARRPPDEVLLQLGENLITQGRARRLAAPVRRLVQGVAGRYGAFRRLMQKEGRWYQMEGFGRSDLGPLELDGLVLAALRSSEALLRRASIAQRLQSAEWAALSAISEILRTQVFVDEAADFSPLQVACMASISGPGSRSFFACGDFNQRLTTWGTREMNQLEWAVKGISAKNIGTVYRQSEQLAELSRALVRVGKGTEAAIALPARSDNRGVAPALLEDGAQDSAVRWIAERVYEIERLSQQLPTIAVLVVGEERVEPVAALLAEQLAQVNIKVIPCRQGQALGQANDVRVFDVKHIKGLEFEAVFFLDVDVLVHRERELFDKYLYVGATRAATYFAMTCQEKLPKQLEELRSMFTSEWATALVG